MTLLPVTKGRMSSEWLGELLNGRGRVVSQSLKSRRSELPSNRKSVGLSEGLDRLAGAGAKQPVGFQVAVSEVRERLLGCAVYTP